MKRSQYPSRMVSFAALGDGLGVHVQDADGGTITRATLPRHRAAEFAAWALRDDERPFLIPETQLQLGARARPFVSRWMHGATANLSLPIDP